MEERIEIDPKLLEILVCPLTKTTLIYDRAHQELISKAAGLAYPIRGGMEDRRIRIPYMPEVRADLRAVTKVMTATGNIRFTAERSENGHADRFWALGLAKEAASSPSGPVEYRSVGRSNMVTGTRQRDFNRPDHSDDRRHSGRFPRGAF